MPILGALALALPALSGGILGLILVMARREQVRFAAARAGLLPQVGALRDRVRDILDLPQTGGPAATDRPALRRARERLAAAQDRFCGSPEFETLRSSEAGEILERLDSMLDDLSASAWACASGPRTDPDALRSLAAATLRLCGRAERRLHTSLAETGREAAAPREHAPHNPQPAHVAARSLSARPHRPDPAPAGRDIGFERLAFRAAPRPPAAPRPNMQARP